MIKEIVGGLFANSGFGNELELWSLNSGLTQGTMIDHMQQTLLMRSIGGTPEDAFRKWCLSQGTSTDYRDCLRQLFRSSSTTIRNALLPS